MSSKSYSLATRVVPPMLLTYAVAAWCIAVLGTERLMPILVITFAWSIVTARQLVAVTRREPQPFEPCSLAQALGAASGQLLWIAVPLLHVKFPDLWVWSPVPMAPGFIVAGIALALAWPLHPFWAARLGWSQDRISRLTPMVDARILCGSFFLLSGHMVFALVGLGSLINNDGREVRERLYTPAQTPWCAQPTA